VIATFVAVTFLVLRARKRGIDMNDAFFMSLFAIIGGFVGARALYIMTMIAPIMNDWHNIELGIGKLVFALVVTGGLVFYGGLIGGVLAALYYLKRYKLDIPVFADLAAPCVPLAHAVGRIGCYMVGCCYGIHAIPIQIIEAGINALLVIVLLCYERFSTASGQILPVYVILYATARFIVEFFRGDSERGTVLWLSTSQFISLLLFAIAAYLLLISARSQKSGESRGGGIEK